MADHHVMHQVQLFTSTQATQAANEANEFLSLTGAQIISISHSTVSNNHSITYSILVVFKTP